jgi:SAM-dependent methyltransferase
MYSELKNCIICKNDLEQVLDLGNQYVVDFVKEKDESLLKAPLTLMRCKKCSFIQLKHKVNPDRLYKKFWYRSSINKMMQDELLKIVENAASTVELVQGDRVLDIGCNDGTLLGWYPKGILTYGVDPCEDLVHEGLNNGKIDVGISDYFSVQNMKGLGKDFKIISAIAMFYDVEDPVQFLKDCKSLLHDEGVLVIQMNYLVKMLNDTAFDNVSHEHLGYYSVLTLKHAVEKAGLTLQGVEETPCNGGSIRCYITKEGNTQFSIRHNSNKLWLGTKMDRMLIEEMRMGLNTDGPYKAFEQSIQDKVLKLIKVLTDLKSTDLLYIYGASTRGTVLSQVLFNTAKFPKSIVHAVAERDAHKYGLRMVGTWFLIVPEEDFREKATHALLLPWHFETGIIEREKAWIKNGGKFIVPLPDPKVVEVVDEPEFVTSSRKL